MSAHRLPLIVAIAFLVQGSLAMAQSPNRSSQEFIEASSPVAGGGSVTTTTTMGNNSRSITRFSGVSSGTTLQPAQQAPQSVLRVPQSTALTTPEVRTPTAAAGSYPYPATAAPASVGFGRPLLGAGRPVAQAYQVPTLGIVPARQTAFRTAQNCDCGPTTTTRFQSSDAALTAPSLNIQVPGEGGNLQTNPNLTLQTQTLGIPQFNSSTRPGWWSPFITGSGSYPSLFKLQNLPPGTYLGQGIIGQPTAYVDGQPVRNLFRYIFP